MMSWFFTKILVSSQTHINTKCNIIVKMKSSFLMHKKTKFEMKVCIFRMRFVKVDDYQIYPKRSEYSGYFGFVKKSFIFFKFETYYKIELLIINYYCEINDHGFKTMQFII